MFRVLTLASGVVLIAMIFAVGFAGSPATTPAPARVAAGPVAPQTGSGGGAAFWSLEPLSPSLSEAAVAPPDHDVCRPLTHLSPPCEEAPPGSMVGAIAGVERWRPLVAEYFRSEDVGQALEVIRCESNGNPGAANPVSTARGLFQHLGSLWPERAARAGWAGADIYDPEANVAVAAWLVYQGGGWRHWNASAHCW
jgi:hypothetical protein